MFAYKRDSLGIERVISVIDGDNVRSLRVAERCGLRREDTIAVLGPKLVVHAWVT